MKVCLAKKNMIVRYFSSSSKNYDLFSTIKTGKEDIVRSGINTNASKTLTQTEDYKKTYLRLFEGNKQYVSEKTRDDPNYFSDRAKTQKPKYLLIGCSDSRVPPNELTKTEPGELFIHRNIANQVISTDMNCMSVIQFAVEYLKVEHVIVMGHTLCGGVIAASKRNHMGLMDQWLDNIRDVAHRHMEELSKIDKEELFIKKLIELNIKQQALNVCKTPFVQKAWEKGINLHVHGWLCDIETGYINDLSINNTDWDNIKKTYNFKF
jgi:carbonic anhydrase